MSLLSKCHATPTMDPSWDSDVFGAAADCRVPGGQGEDTQGAIITSVVSNGEDP